MEGCKSGWVEPLSEETAQEMIKVLNELRTASELEEISNRLTDRIFEDILKDIGLNEDIMEEKKTKKMTKAEAFEWLREKQSPHTLMIIDGNHVELLDGVKSEVWKD